MEWCLENICFTKVSTLKKGLKSKIYSTREKFEMSMYLARRIYAIKSVRYGIDYELRNILLRKVLDSIKYLIDVL